MAQYLTHLILLTIITTGLAQAEVLNDPTTPPAHLAQLSVDSAEVTGPMLQSVILSTHQKAAVINGQFVKVGKKYEESILIRVSETQAILRNPDGSKQVLKMEYPVQKKPVLTIIRNAEYKLRKKPTARTR